MATVIFNIIEFLNFSFIFSVSIFSIMFWIRTKDKYIALCLWVILSTLVFHIAIVFQQYLSMAALAFPGVYFAEGDILFFLGSITGPSILVIISCILFSSSYYLLNFLELETPKRKRVFIFNIFSICFFISASFLFLLLSMPENSWAKMATEVEYQIFPFTCLFIGLQGLIALLFRNSSGSEIIRNEMLMIARNFIIACPLALIDLFLLKNTQIRLSFFALTPFFLHVFRHLSRYYYLNYESLPKESDLKPNMSTFGLTEREQEIALLVIQGNDYNDIAEKLFISVNTVKTHVKKIYKKAGASNKIQLNYKLRTPNPSARLKSKSN